MGRIKVPGKRQLLDDSALKDSNRRGGDRISTSPVGNDSCLMIYED